MKIEQFKQGKDNWGYLLSNKKGEALAVDPLEPEHYQNLLQARGLSLIGILATHYHEDHTAGIPALCERYPVPVFGPGTKEAPHFVTEPVADGPLKIGSFALESHFLPGHSQSHCIYQETKKNWIFVGDLLFHLGCGRVIDNDPIILFESLQYLKDFPTYSELFVGHDYREINHRFCCSLDQKFYSALNLSDLDISTSLEMELWWNPFLKATSFDEWWNLRQRRNTFT